MATIAIDGRPIEYRLVPGDAARPTLVFLHEGLGSVSLWRDFPDKVARLLRCRALVYARQGYGRSAALTAPRTPRFMHDEAGIVLPALLDALGISSPILIGHSDGASIALLYATDPSNATRAVVAMAPHVFVEEITIASIADVTETYARGELRARLARHHDHVDDAFLGWSRIWLSPAFRAWNITAEIATITCPLLLVQGHDDAYGTLAQLDAIVTARPASVQRLVLSHCGHAPHRDQEQLVIDAIAGFCDRLG